VAVKIVYKQEWIPKTGSCTNAIPETIIRPHKIGTRKNPDVPNKLNVNSLIEDMKWYQKNWLYHL
jgi:hypothetical protein